MDAPHPLIQVNGFYEKYIIVGWADFNRHHIVLVNSKVFKTNPESPPPPKEYPQLRKLHLMMNSLLATIRQSAQNYPQEKIIAGFLFRKND